MYKSILSNAAFIKGSLPMSEITSSVNQVPCRICEIEYSFPELPCADCQQVVPKVLLAKRTAIDLNLDHPVLLQIAISVHHCRSCDCYFRAQPPFLRPGAIYTAGVISKVLQSVYEDGMAMRRVTARMARDFWVQPSEGIIRTWCRTYGDAIDFNSDYQAWVIREFSGVLCVDEVYQGKLALLLAVDPAASDGDRLIGYQLVHDAVDATDVQGFLTNLKEAGVEPDQVITDGSKLYPAVLSEVWPHAAHQLCLFHETRHVTKAVLKAIRSIRQKLPQPPPAIGTQGGPLRSHPPGADPADPAAQRWYWRQVERHNQIAHVHELRRQGLSQRAIARQTGHHRATVKRWLAQPVPALQATIPVSKLPDSFRSAKKQRQIQKQQLRARVHDLRKDGLSYSAIARQVGIHRVTVKAWLQQPVPPVPELEPLQSTVVAPPEPWSNWDEVRQVREALHNHRYLLVRRPEKLSPKEQQEIEGLLSSPIGSELQTAYAFLMDWYRLWTDEKGQRRTLAEAQVRYEAWRTNPSYRADDHLRRALDKMTPTKFEKLSQHLRRPTWEATNNGAERTGRSFRHRQAPHFNLRSPESIENDIAVTAHLRFLKCQQPANLRFHHCQRGRKPRFQANCQPEIDPMQASGHYFSN